MSFEYSNRRNLILSGSLFKTARPIRWDEYFNYDPKGQVFRQLVNRFGSRHFPELAILWGPTGSGKTTAARIIGMIACCKQVEQQLRADPAARGLQPCGECPGCVYVQTPGRWTCGYREINGSAGDFRAALAAATADIGIRKWCGSDLLPRVIAIDEAAGLSEGHWKELHKVVEDGAGMTFLLIMREAERGCLTPPMQNRLVGKAYRFAPPNEQQLSSGIIALAQRLGCTLQPEAARWIVRVGQSSPRGVLESLDATRHLWPHVTLAGVKECLPSGDGD